MNILHISCEFSTISTCPLPLDFLVPALVLVAGCLFFSHGASHLDIWSSPSDIGLEETIDWFDWLDPVVLFLATDLFFPETPVLEGGLDTEDWGEGAGTEFFWGLTTFGPVKICSKLCNVIVVWEEVSNADKQIKQEISNPPM